MLAAAAAIFSSNSLISAGSCGSSGLVRTSPSSDASKLTRTNTYRPGVPLGDSVSVSVSSSAGASVSSSVVAAGSSD